jgi:predicted RNA-binding protein (virulence factor B family)
LPQAGESVRVFVYTGEDGYPAASVRTPLALVNEVASLTTLEAGRQGVWLDLGVEEAVFLPRAEQQQRLEPGWRSVVMILEDERLGLIASARLNDFLDDEAEGLAAGEKVSLVVALRTDLGFKAVVNNRYWGMLYADEVFEPLRIGDRREGYIKRLRDDQRLDVSLAPPGYAKVEGASELVLRRLEQAGGFLPLGDHSSPEAIHAEFGISKKVFKQAIGALFRQQRLVIEDDGISLADERRQP